MQFEVKSEVVNEKRGTSKLGRPYLIREQQAYLDVGKPYPVEVKINLDDLAPMKPGKYEIVKECFYVQRYGEVAIDLSKARMVPGAAQTARVAG